MQSHRIHERLKALDIELSPAGAPAAAYVMSAQSGNLVYLSGHIAKKNGKVWVGQLGATMSTDEDALRPAPSRSIWLSTLQAHTGDLNRVKRIVKVMSLVNSTPDFTEQHLVTNGASELFVDVFGDAGKHARSAFGVAQIPLGACVEIEVCVELGWTRHRAHPLPVDGGRNPCRPASIPLAGAGNSTTSSVAEV
ncbi:RidA family protein [Cupriavidus basilensis]